MESKSGRCDATSAMGRGEKQIVFTLNEKKKKNELYSS